MHSGSRPFKSTQALLDAGSESLQALIIMAAPPAFVAGKGKGKAPPPATPSAFAGGKGKAEGKGAYASLKNDKEWILGEAVRRPGRAILKYAQADLKRDEEFVLAL